MTEFTKRYYPTICIRRAEMKAMENLPLPEKCKMLPIVLLAPWLNSIEFDNTFRIVEKCLGDIPIVVDIDRYFSSNSSLPSREYFRELISPSVGPIRWMELIEHHVNYVPCIQIVGVSPDLISTQVDFFRALGRGFVIRLELSRFDNLDFIYKIIEDNIDDNFLIVLDYGYSKLPQLVEMNLSAIIDRIIAISDQIKIAIAGSNFPNEFSEYDDFATSEAIQSRMIYNNLSRKYGNYNFFYGDWASTKPRTYDGGGSKPLPRIDFPTASNWIISRSKEQEWDFQTAAEMVLRLPEWDRRPMVWGTGMIEKAAKGLPGGIATGPQAIASRVNIHLYLQNNFGMHTPPTGPKGKWVDPI